MNTISMSMNLSKLKRLQRKSPEKFRTAMERGAIEFLNWANNGSQQETRKPPIRWGVLRGSASAFVGNKLVHIFKQSHTEGEPTPLTSFSESPTTATWVWNTPYAHRMHEHTGEWGKFTEADDDAGNKWLEKHLIADKEALMKMIEKEYWKEVTGL